MSRIARSKESRAIEDEDLDTTDLTNRNKLAFRGPK
jgi:hypothetical protein